MIAQPETPSMTNLIKQVENERHHVVVDVYSATLNELMDQFANADLKIDPAYQRAFRWSTSQQTRYLESLLLNIPTPPFFLAESPDGTFEIIDGLQRFSTVLKFFAAERTHQQREPSDSSEHQNNITIPTLLTDAPILRDLDGESRETLPDTLVRTLRYARIQVMLLKKESSPLARFHVFTRLNRAGSSLSNQEIRNCSARLFNASFADELLQLSERPSVVAALALSEKDRKSMGAAENILRLIAFSHFEPQSQRVEEFLDEVMYKIASGEFFLSAIHKDRLIRTFDLISKELPSGEAFRFYKDDKFKGGFSSNLFDIIACGIYKNISSISKRPAGWLETKIVALNLDEKAIALTGAGSNTRAKMIGRAKLGATWFRK